MLFDIPSAATGHSRKGFRGETPLNRLPSSREWNTSMRSGSLNVEVVCYGDFSLSLSRLEPPCCIGKNKHERKGQLLIHGDRRILLFLLFQPQHRYLAGKVLKTYVYAVP